MINLPIHDHAPIDVFVGDLNKEGVWPRLLPYHQANLCWDLRKLREAGGTGRLTVFVVEMAYFV